MATDEFPVLIVGAGPTGMSLALALDRFGVSSLVVDRHATTTEHPKARGITARTMELFRLWGLEDEIRAAAMPDASDVVCWCTSLSGPFVAVTNPEPPPQSPAPKSTAPQDVVERALDGAIATRPRIDVRRSHELVSFRDDGEDGVVARIRPVFRGTPGAEVEVRAAYLVGCDGSSSPVRRSVGIAMEGRAELARMVSHYVRAGLGHLPHVRQYLSYSVVPDDPGRAPFLVATTGPHGDRWVFVQILGDGVEPMTEPDLVALMRDEIGDPDLDVQLIDSMPWRISAQVAARFRAGRVFLAGDAAHRFPPSGGQGLNSGVQDAHNLAWKLAMVLNGHASESLLDSYETERRPVAVSNTEFSVGNLDRMGRTFRAFAGREADPDAWRAAVLDQDNHIHSNGQGLGFVYRRGALVDDGSPLPAPDARYFWPTDRPGARFPHVWTDTARTCSTLDWFDTRFVLVCGPRADGWRHAGERIAAGTPARLDVRTLPGLYGPFTITERGAVLVRPDGHVAWRATGPGEPADLADALRHILHAGVPEPVHSGA